MLRNSLEATDRTIRERRERQQQAGGRMLLGDDEGGDEGGDGDAADEGLQAGGGVRGLAVDGNSVGLMFGGKAGEGHAHAGHKVRLPRPFRGDPSTDDAFATIMQWLHSRIPHTRKAGTSLH